MEKVLVTTEAMLIEPTTLVVVAVAAVDTMVAVVVPEHRFPVIRMRLDRMGLSARLEVVVMAETVPAIITPTIPAQVAVVVVVHHSTVT